MNGIDHKNNNKNHSTKSNTTTGSVVDNSSFPQTNNNRKSNIKQTLHSFHSFSIIHSESDLFLGKKDGILYKLQDQSNWKKSAMIRRQKIYKKTLPKNCKK